MKYEYFDVTADVGVKAFGSTINEVFENSAIAVFHLMCSTKNVAHLKQIRIQVKSTDLEGLIREWLTQLLGLKDIHGMMFSKFKVQVDEKKMSLEGVGWGEETQEKHLIKTEVKAVTSHLIEVKKNEQWQAKFILDL